MIFVNLIDSIPALLFKHNCVIIPNFGGFITNYKPAGFEENRFVINPSSKKVAFNQSLVENDGLLVNAWANQKQITYQESLTEVLDFSDFLKEKITTHKSFDFKNIGTFYLNSEGRIIFVPYQGLNFLESSYGLFPVKIKSLNQTAFSTVQAIPHRVEPVENLQESAEFATDIQAPLPVHRKNINVWFKAASVILIGGLVSLYIYSNTGIKQVKVKESNKEQHASIIHMDSNKDQVTHISKPTPNELDYKVEQEKINEIKQKVNAFVKENKRKQESYNVVIGYFKSEKTANQIYNRIIKEYPSAQLSETSSEGFGIVVENFYSHNTANTFCVMLKQNGYKHTKIEKQMTLDK